MVKDRNMSSKSEEESNSNDGDTGANNSRIFESYDEIDNCKLNTLNRVRYFTGQLLLPEDFTHEQNYFNSKRHLTNKLVSGTGIVCGLHLQIADQGPEYLQVRISSGLAIDCCGKEIVVKNDKNISLKIDQRLFGKATKRVGLFLTGKEILKSPVPVHLTDSSSEGRLSESRIEESYKLVLKSVGERNVKIEFDKTRYNTEDKVRIELWDPDKLATKSKKDSKQQEGKRGDGDNVKINISSNKDRNGVDISLRKLRDNIYAGEINLTKSRESANRLTVSESDIIKAKYNDEIFTNAFVTSSNYSFILDERKVITSYYDNKLVKCYQEESSNHKTLNINNNNNQKHGVLLAILKTKGRGDKDDRQALDIDEDETDMYREIVYNNQLLYDLVSENKRQLEGEKRSQGTVLSDIYEIPTKILEELKPNHYHITEPIKFLENNPLYSHLSLEFPPIIILGRTTYKNSDNVMYFEDFDFNIVKKYTPNTKVDEKRLNEEMNPNQMQSISCKPLAVTNNSFRVIITKDSKEHDTTELVLRWWAMCQFREQ
jgi:hypothetical protein